MYYTTEMVDIAWSPRICEFEGEEKLKRERVYNVFAFQLPLTFTET